MCLCMILLPARRPHWPQLPYPRIVQSLESKQERRRLCYLYHLPCQSRSGNDEDTRSELSIAKMKTILAIASPWSLSFSPASQQLRKRCAGQGRLLFFSTVDSLSSRINLLKYHHSTMTVPRRKGIHVVTENLIEISQRSSEKRSRSSRVFGSIESIVKTILFRWKLNHKSCRSPLMPKIYSQLKPTQVEVVTK